MRHLRLTTSIALCTYNGSRFLREQLESLANQTRLPDEVVVGDDGSTDGTVEILEHWAQTVSFPVRIFRNETNLGFSKNFEQTILRCSGDVIFTCDQDDIWMAEKIEIMTDYFEKDPSLGYGYCLASTIDEHGNMLDFPRAKLCRAQYITNHWGMLTPNWKRHANAAGCCLAVRRDLVQKLYPLPQDAIYDSYIFAMGTVYMGIFTVPRQLIQYRIHGSNASLEGGVLEYERLRQKAATAYRWLPEWCQTCRMWQNRILEILRQAPDSPGKRVMQKYILGNIAHYENRQTIQRCLLFNFPLLVWELVHFRYFTRVQPIRSLLYDVGCGVFHSFQPSKIKAEWKIVWQKLKRKFCGSETFGENI
ncbi:MAG: glycosyltransferase [Planctomycetia bacterium]|nr:glycosyltransferase [Planctomycetia bacterium]